MGVQRRIIVIVYLDGRQERIPIRPRLEMHFERTYKVGINRLAEGSEGATNVYRLAWEAVKAQNGHAPMQLLDEWSDTIDVVDIEFEEVAPFVEGAPAGGSHNSASQLDSLPAS